MMKENPHVGCTRHVVEPFMDDATGHLSWGHLGRSLLHGAQLHADRHGFGYGATSPEGLTWVLSRLTIELCGARPRVGEPYEVLTWASTIQRHFTTRLFTLTHPADGTPWAHVHSVWALLNLQTRQPANLGALAGPDHAPTYGGHPTAAAPFAGVLVPPPPSFPIHRAPGAHRLEHPQEARQRTVRFTDLDANGHLNSIRAMEYVLDLFPAEHHRLTPPRFIAMAYAHEALPGQQLRMLTETTPDGTHHVELRPEGSDEAAIRAQIRFT